LTVHQYARYDRAGFFIHQCIMADNPYQAPSANLGGIESFGARTGSVTQGIVEQLRRTKGWTRFIGVLFIIIGVIMLIGAIFGGGSMASMGRSLDGISGLAGIIMAVYGLMGVLYLVAGARLSAFSSAVQRLMYSGQESDLEDALERQRKFWFFMGVLMIVIMVVVVIGVISAIASI
jgi:uncharacterized membrane protein YhaH (DUF805 family)